MTLGENDQVLTEKEKHAMTHHDDARLDDLLAQLGNGDSRDLFRRLLERGMQDLIDSELTATIGAELHERTDTRTNQRNGARERTLSTPSTSRCPSARSPVAITTALDTTWRFSRT